MSNKKYDKKMLVESYSSLARKLGKLPSSREYKKFVCSSETIIRVAGSFNALKQEALETYPQLADLEVPVSISDIDLENYKLEQLNKHNKKFNKSVVAGVNEVDDILKLVPSVIEGRIKASPYKSKKPTKRFLNIVLSDTHFGSDIDGEETGGSSFGKVEEARRLAKVVQEVLGYKPQHRAETELNVMLLGDIFQGMLGHDPRDGAELAEQFCRSLHLLLQALGQFSTHFKKVNVYVATGNHGRSGRHPGRAIHGKYDSFETMLYYSLKSATSQIPNISFVIPKTPHVVVEVFGHRLFATHGDTVLNVGSVGKSINSKAIEAHINKINASLPDNKEYAAFIMGHLHLGTVSFLSNGTVLMVNGGLPPADSFAVSLGLYESNAGQMMFESVEGFPVGDIRYIRVDAKVDKDSKLDSIIKPWNNY